MLKRNVMMAAVLAAAAAILLAGCGGGGSSTSGTGPLTTLPGMNQTTPAGGTLKVFLVKGDTVTQLMRQVAGAAADPARQALQEMLKGPTSAETDQGISTAIPAGTTLLSYKVAGGTATADFSKEMLNYGGGSARVQAIIGQIDNTVTGNDPSVKTVSVTVEGKPSEESLQP